MARSIVTNKCVQASNVWEPLDVFILLEPVEQLFTQTEVPEATIGPPGAGVLILGKASGCWELECLKALEWGCEPGAEEWSPCRLVGNMNRWSAGLCG